MKLRPPPENPLINHFTRMTKMAEVRPIPELQDAFKPAPLRGQSREDYRADLTDRIVGVLLDNSPSNSDKTSCRAAVETLAQ